MLFASVLCAILDSALGLWVERAGGNDGTEKALFVVHTVGRLALAGCILALVARVLAFLTRRAQLQIILVGLATAVGFVMLNESLTEGGGISRWKYVGALRWTLRTVAPLGCFVAIVWGGRRWLRHVQAPTIVSRVLGLVVLGAAFVLLWANLTQHPNRYPDIHSQLGYAAFGLVIVAVSLLIAGTRLDPRRGRLAEWKLLAAMAFLIVVAIVAQRHDRFARVEALELRSTATTNEYRSFYQDVFGAFTAPPRERPEFTIDLGTVDEEAVRKALDEAIPDRGEFNVLWIAIDTLRADHTGFTPRLIVGDPAVYDRHDTTPRMNEVAENAFVFRQGYSSYPTSNFAYNSVLTGLTPRSTHSYNDKYDMGWDFSAPFAIPQIVADAGIRSACVTAFNRGSSHDNKWFGHMRHGFESYNAHNSGSNLSSAEVAKHTIAEIRQSRGKQSFWFMHLVGPHDPYFDAENEVSFPGDAATDGYDSDIREADRQVGAVFDEIRAAGEWDKTIVVIFSDHGEAFGEHGATKHNGNLYEEQIRVPLMIRVPGLKGRLVEGAASIVDLLPTTLSLLGIEDPLPRQGRNLIPRMLSSAPSEGFAYSERFIARGGQDDDQMRCVILGSWKLVETDIPPRPVYELFNLADDPKELKNHYALPEHRDMEDKMVSLLRQEFTRFDSYHDTLAGRETTTPKERWRKKLDESMRVVEGDDEAAAISALKDFSDLVFDSYGAVDGAALRYTDQPERTALAQRFVTLAKTTSHKRLRSRLPTMLMNFRDPALADYWRQLLENKSARNRLLGARALAMMGMEDGKPELEKAVSTGSNPELFATVCFLVMAGGGEIYADALWPVSRLSHNRLVVLSLEAMAALKHPQTGRQLRDSAYYGVWNASRIKLGAIAAVAHQPSDLDAIHILLKYGRDQNSDIRAAALAKLEGVFKDQAELDRNLQAYTDYVDGMKQAAYGKWSEGIALIDRAIKNSSFSFTAARFSLAQLLRKVGRGSEVASLLEPVIASGGGDKARAESMLAAISADSPVHIPREEFKLECSWPAVDWDKSTKGRPVAIKMQVKNTGPYHLTGGRTLFSPRFSVGWRAGDKETRLPRAHLSFLPDAGIAPGESGEMIVVLRSPGAVKGELFVDVEIPWEHYYLKPLTFEVDGQ